MKYAFLILLVIIFIVAGPLLVIWSMNILFSLNILYTFNTWLAVYILMTVLSVTAGSNHRNLG